MRVEVYERAAHHIRFVRSKPGNVAAYLIGCQLRLQFRRAGIRYSDGMELVKLGKKGQLSIPRAILKKLSIDREMPMSVEITADGAIILRQVGIYPLEIYTEQRLQEFEEADSLSDEEAQKLRALGQ